MSAKLENQIQLNFYSFTKQQFKFKVWRKEYDASLQKDDIYRGTLPKSNNLDDRLEYLISFEPLVEYEEFICESNFNHKLTNKYVFYLIRKKIISVFSESEFRIDDKFRRQKINFILKKHDLGSEECWIEPFYLQPKQKFGFLINFNFHKNPDSPFSREIQVLSLSLDQSYRSNRNFYIDKFQKVTDYLSENKNKIFPLVTNCDDELSLELEMEELPVKSLDERKYIFENEQIASNQFRGISSYGPLQKIEKGISFFYIFKEEHRYLVDDLKKALRGELSGIAFNGLESVFKLNIDKEYEKIITDYSNESLLDALNEVKKTKETCPNVFPIFVEDVNEEEAYYYLKYQMMQEKIPSQTISFQLLGRRNQLKWSVSNFALQIFVKAGGMPWKVSQQSKDLIFGIGQSHIFENGYIVKYFTYSVCADSSGIYKKVNVLGKSSDETSYLTSLKRNMISVINEHLSDNYSRCVLHVPFKIKFKELESINDAIAELNTSRSDIEFVVLKINPDNKFFGYANTNSLIPYEGSFVPVSNTPKGYLVWFDGLQIHNETVSKRVQGPIHIELYWSSKKLEDEEVSQLLQEVLNLSGANWRGFNSTKWPISMFYCKLIAIYLKNFPAEIENIEQVKVPWFI
jgi:hypothetical protein